MGASEADGGRRGRWGQTRLVGAGKADGGGKPPASYPCPPASDTKEATGPNPYSTLMGAVIWQTWILRMRRFPRRKGSLGMMRNRKRRRAMRRRGMRRDMRKMSWFQTMTWSTA